MFGFEFELHHYKRRCTNGYDYEYRYNDLFWRQYYTNSTGWNEQLLVERWLDHAEHYDLYGR